MLGFYARGFFKKMPLPLPKKLLAIWARLNLTYRYLRPPRSEGARVTSKISRSEQHLAARLNLAYHSSLAAAAATARDTHSLSLTTWHNNLKFS